MNKLRPGDAVELICPVVGFPKHYTVFMGTRKGSPEFIANMTEGVRLVRDQELQNFLVKYEVTKIERFEGNDFDRKSVVRKALSRLGEKAYSFVFNNCEHFKNWVLYGEPKSHQVAKISTFVALTGVGFLVAGLISDKKSLQKVGSIILITLFIILIIAWVLLYQKKEVNIKD
jgi:hypothetical protein